MFDPQEIHAVMVRAGMQWADLCDHKGVMYHYVYLSSGEFQLWREGNQPTNYVVPVKENADV